MSLDDVPLDRARVFRASPVAVGIISLVMGAIVAAGAWGAFNGGILLGSGKDGIPAVLCGWVAAWLGMFWLFYANDLWKLLSSDAWLAALDETGLYLKWRSYRNTGWGRQGLQVVFVPNGAMSWAREHSRRTVTPEDGGGARRWEHHSFVEIGLADVDISALAKHLAWERDGRPGGVKSSMKWGHFPLSVEPGGVLRIEWRALPGRRVFLAELASRGVAGGPAVASAVDLTGDAGEESLKELARRGDTLAVVRVLRAQNASLSLAEAKARAEALAREAQG